MKYFILFFLISTASACAQDDLNPDAVIEQAAALTQGAGEIIMKTIQARRDSINSNEWNIDLSIHQLNKSKIKIDSALLLLNQIITQTKDDAIKQKFIGLKSNVEPMLSMIEVERKILEGIPR